MLCIVYSCRAREHEKEKTKNEKQSKREITFNHPRSGTPVEQIAPGHATAILSTICIRTGIFTPKYVVVVICGLLHCPDEHATRIASAQIGFLILSTFYPFLSFSKKATYMHSFKISILTKQNDTMMMAVELDQSTFLCFDFSSDSYGISPLMTTPTKF